jgi:hypothetical protein
MPKPGDMCLDCIYRKEEAEPCQYQLYADMVNNDCPFKAVKDD